MTIIMKWARYILVLSLKSYSTNDVKAKETDTLRIKWVEKGNIESYDDFETWSALILQDL